MGNAYNMSIIIQNKLVLDELFLEKYQIEFLDNMHLFKAKFWLLIEMLIIVGLTKVSIIMGITKVASLICSSHVGEQNQN